MNQPAGTRSASRIPELGVLRGLALVGVLVVNIDDWLAGPAGPIDQAVVWITDFLFRDKFWPLFSFLFGLGFSIQLMNAAARGAPVLWTHIRRMVALYAFGLILLVFLAGNPILVRYALVGTLLLPFQRLRPRAVIIAAVLVLSFAVVARPLWVDSLLRNPPSPTTPVQPTSPTSVAQSDVSKKDPTLWSTTVESFRRAFAPPGRPIPWLAQQAEILAMFLVGLYVGKRRIHSNLHNYRPQLNRIVWLGLALGFTGSAVAIVTADWSKLGVAGMLLSNLARCLGGDLQSLGYAAGAVLLVGRVGTGPAIDHLALAGRMPLTNYLVQWLLMRIVFDRFFLGLDGRVGPALGIVIAATILAAQFALSQWWLSRYRFGPAEWLWKSFAYLTPQPMQALTPAR